MRIKFLKIVKRSAFFLFIFLLIGIVINQASKLYLKYSTSINTSNGISLLKEISLPAGKQWIFIRGYDINNPVLLFLHGGPGEPAWGMAGARNSDSELIKYFTVVHWDQLGAGKSFNSSLKINSMNIGNWIKDCNELIDYLRNKLKKDKIYLVGHSGGSIVGMEIAHKYPEKIEAYIGIAQIVNNYEQQKASYKFIVKESLKYDDLDNLNAINEIGPPPYKSHNKELEKAKFIINYGGFIHNNLWAELGLVLLSYLTSPEYSSFEAINTILGRGLNFTMSARYEEIKKVDFFSNIQSLNVPIYFIQGKYDMIAPTKLLKIYFNNLIAQRGKRLIIFENSAHIPMVEEREKFQDLLIHDILGK